MTVPARSPRARTRVLVVDDSIFMRKTLERMIGRMPGCEVVGTAADGIEAVQRAVELRPDVITMDVEMPRLDGVHAVTEIMRVLPTPVVMLSTLTREGAETTIRALEAGAVDCVAKPSALSHDLPAVEMRLAEAIARASVARVRPRSLRAVASPAASARDVRPVGTEPAKQVVVIGCSTGGPPALTEIIPRLPANLRAAVVVVQHMPPGFTDALARRLDSLAPLAVAEARNGDLLAEGRVLVAPGDFHLDVTPDRRVHLHQSPAMHGVRPAIDVTLESVARVYGRRATVAILTGMGKDGAAGAAIVEQAGGRVFVQDEATSVVWGMPRVTLTLTQRATELPIERIADAITAAVGMTP